MGNRLFSETGIFRCKCIFLQEWAIVLPTMLEETPIGGLAQNEVTRLIVSRHHEHEHRVIIRPGLWVVWHAEVKRVVVSKVATKKTLWSHIKEWIRDAIKPSITHISVQRPGECARGGQDGSFRVGQ